MKHYSAPSPFITINPTSIPNIGEPWNHHWAIHRIRWWDILYWWLGPWFPVEIFPYTNPLNVETLRTIWTINHRENHIIHHYEAIDCPLSSPMSQHGSCRPEAAFITEVLGADRVVVRGDDIDKEIKGVALVNSAAGCLDRPRAILFSQIQWVLMVI